MTQVGTNINAGMPITLSAADHFTPTISGGDSISNLVVLALQFDASWSGTVQFQGGVMVSGSMVWDPVSATNLNGGSAATSTTGGTPPSTELWRIDVAALDGVRAYVSAFATGTVAVTPRWTIG